MRTRLAAAAACLTLFGCAAARAPLVVEETPLPLAAAPPLPAPPARGIAASTEARFVRIHVTTTETVTLEGWCRVGVWTTLSRLDPHAFVVRETWGRLGERAPRLLLRVPDQVLGGVEARLRPEADGTLRFHLRVSGVRVEAAEPMAHYHGQPVVLPTPRRHGYHFSGRAPANWTGAVARWEKRVLVRLGDGAGEPRPAVRFAAGPVDGFVAGEAPRAETFVETWHPADPIATIADGVERKDFRLVPRRIAAGFAPEGASFRTFGTRIRVERISASAAARAPDAARADDRSSWGGGPRR